jgi:proteic killer suppression protein
MIYSFKCKETEKVFNRIISEKFPKDIQRSALRKLRMLNRAADLLVSPGKAVNKSNSRGHHSMRINDNWRISFYWDEKFASHVELVEFK